MYLYFQTQFLHVKIFYVTLIALTGLTENDYLLQNTIQYHRQRTINIITIEPGPS